MTNLEGRVLRRRRRSTPPARRADRALGLIARSAPPARRAGRLGHRRRARSSTSCAGPAPAAAPTTRASATTRIDAEEASSGPARPPTPAPHPGTPRLFLDRFPTPDGRARIVAGRAPAGPAEDLRRRYPVYLVTGRRAAALPVRRADPPGRGARRGGARRRSSSSTPLSPRGCGVDGRATACGSPPARGVGRRGRARITDDDPPGHRVHAVPLGRRGQRQPGHQRRARPGLGDAGVQGVRGRRRRAPPRTGLTRRESRRTVRRMTRSSSSATAWSGTGFVEELLGADRAGRFDVDRVGAEAYEPYNRVLLSEVRRRARPTLVGPDAADAPATSGSRCSAGSRRSRDRPGGPRRRRRRRQPARATTCSSSRPASAARVPPLAGLAATGRRCRRGVHVAPHPRRRPRHRRRDAQRPAGRRARRRACSASRPRAGCAGAAVASRVVHPAAALMERQLDAGAGRGRRVGAGRPRHRPSRRRRRRRRSASTAGRCAACASPTASVLGADLLVLARGTGPSTGLAAAAGLADRPRHRRGRRPAPAPATRASSPIGDCAAAARGRHAVWSRRAGSRRRRLAATAVRAPGTSRAPRPAAARPRRRPAQGRRHRPGHDGRLRRRSGRTTRPSGRCGSATPTAAATSSSSSRDGVLVGATCVGAAQVAADLVAAFDRRTPAAGRPGVPAAARPSTPVPARGAGSPPRMPGAGHGLPVQRRHQGATSSRAWHDGATAVEEVAAATRATTGCGGCADAVCGIVDWLAAADPPQHHASTQRSENRCNDGRNTMIHSTETAAA